MRDCSTNPWHSNFQITISRDNFFILSYTQMYFCFLEYPIVLGKRGENICKGNSRKQKKKYLHINKSSGRVISKLKCHFYIFFFFSILMWLARKQSRCWMNMNSKWAYTWLGIIKKKQRKKGLNLGNLPFCSKVFNQLIMVKPLSRYWLYPVTLWIKWIG